MSDPQNTISGHPASSTFGPCLQLGHIEVKSLTVRDPNGVVRAVSAGAAVL